jgi:hypothetical protein
LTSPHDTRPSAHRFFVPACGVLALVVLAAGLVTVAVRRSNGPTTRARPAGSTAPAPPATSTSTTALPASSSGEPAYITTIKAQVAELRGLAWKSPLKVDVVSKDELAARVRSAIQRDRRPDRMDGDGDTYKILHLIPGDLDYTKTIDDLYSGLVLGFYDPKTKELVVGDTASGNGDVDGATKVTLAHELDHALTDQWFNFGDKEQALDDADREEEVDAFTALIEGDAKFLEGRYAEADLTEEEQLAYALQGLGGGDTDTGAAAKLLQTPPFLLRYLYFPYEDGLAFVKAEAGDAADVNAGIDAAYRRPPTSTEAILHPDVYATDQGWTPPQLPDVAGATGCDARRRNTLGEFKMGELLGAELDVATATAAAQGWNGDVFETVRCGTALGLVDRWQADGDAAASRLAAALTQWAPGWAGSPPPVGGRFSGPNGTGRILRTGSVVTLVLGADVSTADRLVTAAGG